MNKITVIIINYKSEDILTNAINSIQEDYLHISILILDNESTSDSYKKLLQILNKNVKIIRSEQNLGFANGVNFAYTYLEKNSIIPKYIFLLNPDATIQKNMIFNLFNILEKNVNVAAISPRIVGFDGRNEYIGTNIDWTKCIVGRGNVPKVDKTTNTSYVDVFHGCAVLLNSKIFYQAGMFNKKIFMYYDEAFLSMEILKLSYKIMYSDQNITYHYGSYSSVNFSFTKSYYHTRNHLLFFKEYSTKSNVFCKYKAIIITLLSSIKHLRFNKLLGELRGIYDFWLGKTGKLQ